MQILIVTSLGLVWTYSGYLFLSWARIDDKAIKIGLSTSVGMALFVFALSTLSFAGLSLSESRWVVFPLLCLSLIYWQRLDRAVFCESLGHLGFVIAINLLSAGLGILIYGSVWQGLVNTDAATNSLAAQYFISHSFYAHPNFDSVITGLDYSPLSSELYVALGHRFGDVMLLGFTATASGMNPDEIYMVHGLILKCSMVLAFGCFAFNEEMKRWRLAVLYVAITLSPFAAYTYLNQLISQMGGSVLMAAATVLGARLLSEQEKVSTRLVIVLAVVLASLLRYYPEMLPFWGLSLVFYFIFVSWVKGISSGRKIINSALLLTILVLVLSNVSLPNSINHMLGALGAGMGGGLRGKVASLDIFSYAFTPDSLTLLAGFKTLEEFIREPWDFTLFLFAIIAFLVMVFGRILFLRRHVLFLSVFASYLVAFGLLFLRQSTFGTFKAMIQIQPLISLLVGIAILESISARRHMMLFSMLFFLSLNARAMTRYIDKSISSSTSTTFTHSRLINDIENTIAHSIAPIMIESPSYTFYKFSLLRPKSVNTQIAGGDHYSAFKRYSGKRNTSSPLNSFQVALFRKWSADYDKSLSMLIDYGREVVSEQVFGCSENDLSQPKIPYILPRPTSKTLVVPGGNLIPLNRRSFGYQTLLAMSPESLKDFLVYRESSLGYYFERDFNISGIYALEKDPLYKGMTITGVGQYLVLEILGASTEDVRLAIQFTRSYLGASRSALPIIRVIGSNTVLLGGYGAGSLSDVTDPVRPCIVDGHKILIIDFGSSEHIKKLRPLAYRLLNAPYDPDKRNLSGFIRDISVYTDNQKPNVIDSGRDISWSIDHFTDYLYYSGIYEDGWLSRSIMIRPKKVSPGKKMILTINLPTQFTDHYLQYFDVTIDGKMIQNNTAMPGGRSTIVIDEKNFEGIRDPAIKLNFSQGYSLPGNDGREVAAQLVSVGFN